MTTEVNPYFLVTALLLALFGFAATWFLAGTHRRRPWDALPFVLSPALLVTGLVNWDLMAVAMFAGALWAWSRDRPVLTGVLIGLGTATKLYPLFLLGPILIIAWRRRSPGPVRVGRRRCGGRVGAWPTCRPGSPGSSSGRSSGRFNTERGADWGPCGWSWPTPATASPRHDQPVVLGALRGHLRGGRCAGAARAETPRLAQLGFLVVAGFLLVNKVYSPQYVLWLLPLAVLARPRWRDLLIWQAGELFYFVAVWPYFGGWLEESTGGESPVYDLAILVRVAAQIYLVAVVVRDVLRPQHDPVRMTRAGAPGTSGRSSGSADLDRGRRRSR